MDTLPSLLSEKFIERLARLYGDKRLTTIMTALQTKPLPSFRTNTLVTTTTQLISDLKSQGFEIQALPWYEDGFILCNRSTRELTETKNYHNGQLYIQNLSSMIPALVLNPQPGETILDIAAAPGSKTTQMAALMKNEGTIIANDISRTRLYKLSNNLKMAHVINTQMLNFPGQKLWKKYPEYFDKTLVDAPCSMEGRIRLDEPETYNDWKVGKIKQLAPKQKYLLRSAISATKVGGTIVYSTCTLSPEENEEVIDWLLKKEGDAISLEEIKIKNLKLEPGLTYWNKPFNPQLVKCARINPSASMEGFFIAKIIKHHSTLHPKQLSY